MTDDADDRPAPGGGVAAADAGSAPATDTAAPTPWWPFARRAVLAAAVAVGLFALAFLLWKLKLWVAVAFLAVVLGAALHHGAEALARHTPMGRKLSLAVIVGVLALLLIGFGFLTYDGITRQLPDNLQKSVDQFRGRVEETPVGAVVPDKPPPDEQEGGLLPGFEVQSLLQRGLGVLYDAVTVLTGAVLVSVTAIYLAVEPKLYRDGFVKLVPPRHRERVRQTLVEIGRTLGRWVLGRTIDMIILGAVTYVGLLLLGVPLPLTLAILTGLLCFIPNFGPVLSVIPPVLLAMGSGEGGMMLAVWVILLYIGIQALESYLLTPLIQKKAVEVPPALLIITQVLGGALIGAMGVLLAAPFLAAATVAVRRLYVRPALEDRPPD